MNKIKVLLVDDHTIVRKGLAALLQSETDIEVAGEAEDGREALIKTDVLQPDVVIMDIGMPNLNGLEAAKRITKKHPEIKVLVLTMHSSDEYIFDILKNGASGYLLKKTAPEELVKAIRTVWRGGSYLGPFVTKKVINEFVQKKEKTKSDKPVNLLTPRERDVLQLVAEGSSNRQIADLLFISIKTVDVHRTKIMQKLDLHSAADLTRYAILNGIINPENN